MRLTEKIAFLKGLLEGMELDTATKEGKAITQMAEVMEEMAVYIDDLQSQVDELTELCDILDEDLGGVESDLYGDDDDDDDDEDDEEDYPLGNVLPAEDYDGADYDEDDEDYDDTQYIVTCPSCGETVTLTEDELAEGSMDCPFCGETLEFDYDAIETDLSDEEPEDSLDDADHNTETED